MGKSSGETKTVSTIDPEIKPYLIDFTKSLTTEYDKLKGLNPVPDFNTYVGPSGATSDALGNISALARAGNPYQAATQNMYNTGAGQYGDIASTGGFNPGMDMARGVSQGSLYNANAGGIQAGMGGAYDNANAGGIQAGMGGAYDNANLGGISNAMNGGLYNANTAGLSNAMNGLMGNEFTGRAANIADGGLYNTTNPMLQGIAEGNLYNTKAGMADTVAQGGLYNTDRALFDSFINGGRAITAGNLVGDMATAGAANPYLDQMFGRAADQVQGRVQGAMNRNGNLNSSFSQAGMQDALSGLATDMYGGQYQQGQQNRLAAAGLMGQFQGQNQQAALQAASQAANTTAQDRERQLSGVNLAVNTAAQDRDRQLQGASLLQQSVAQDRDRQLSGTDMLLRTSAQDRDRQFQGANAFANIGAADRDRQFQGANAFANAGNQNVDRRFNAANSFANIGAQNATNRFNSANAFANIGAADRDRQFQGINQVGALGQQNIANRLSALQGQQGLMQMMPALNDARYADARSLLGVGQQSEQYQQNYINDLLNRFNARRNGNIPLAQQVGQVFTGLAGGTQMAPYQTPDRTGQMIGAGATLGAALLMSSRDFKDRIGEAPDVLAALESLPVEMWTYKPTIVPGGAVHIGPYAQDVHKALGIGDGQTIPVVDMIGALIKGVQELTARVKELEAA